MVILPISLIQSTVWPYGLGVDQDVYTMTAFYMHKTSITCTFRVNKAILIIL